MTKDFKRFNFTKINQKKKKNQLIHCPRITSKMSTVIFVLKLQLKNVDH